ncbi:MAG: exonuclease domain-containing protein [Gemmatimonadota bacterium]
MTGSGGQGLASAALRLLAEGPCPSGEIARRVMKLRGDPGAAAAAVFALLGRDSRFRVDGSGVWSLAPDALGRPDAPLSRTRFAVVDVETTGGAWSRGHRVTEVAVVPVESGRVREGFETLVNPLRPIPPRIQGLTGITDPMVARAPSFPGIAPAVRDRLEGCVFVAHNVHFDWGFIREELLAALGETPDPTLLCTVRMGRALVPGLRSYGLDSLTRHFGIHVHDRHRAYGDALATARLLVHLLMEAEAQGIGELAALEECLAPRGRRRTRAR